MKQSEKLTQLLELMQANPELPVIPCVDGDVVGGDEYYCWLGSWGESAVQEFIIGKERTYYREDDISEMNDVLYERYDTELVDNMTDEETRAAHNADIDTEGTPEEFDMTLCEHLFDGPETIEGLLAEHYTLSWALASLRDKLKHYEDARIPEIMPEGLQTIERAIGTYGKDAQLTKAVEEMSELTKALCKLKECKRKYDTPFNRETQEVCSNIEEEIADVFIMLVQLFAIFNLRELVNITKIVWDKLDRLKDNLDKEAAKKEGRKDVTPEC